MGVGSGASAPTTALLLTMSRKSTQNPGAVRKQRGGRGHQGEARLSGEPHLPWSLHQWGTCRVTLGKLDS